MVSSRPEKMSIWELLYRVCQGILISVPAVLFIRYVWNRCGGNKLYFFTFFILLYVLISLLQWGFSGKDE